MIRVPSGRGATDGLRSQHLEDESDLSLYLKQAGTLGLEGALRPGKLVGGKCRAEFGSCLRIRPASTFEAPFDVVREVRGKGQRQMADI
jgi:hypothetical protein